MKRKPLSKLLIFFTSAVMAGIFLLSCEQESGNDNALVLNEKDYFKKRGLDVLVFSNWYSGYFSDSKMSGVELIHHGVRTATNGDVRLNRTPEQWDPIPTFGERKVNHEEGTIEAHLSYPDHDFKYTIKAKPGKEGMLLSVHLKEPLPEALEGKAGFNLEFIPSSYFEKAYMMDGETAIFPLYPSGPTTKAESGRIVPEPLAEGNELVLAPEDPERKVTVRSADEKLRLYDGRNKAQNGWFVVRSLLPSGETGKVIEWSVKAHTIAGWTRKPMIAHSQVGYHPEQKKKAIIELDKNDRPLSEATLLKVDEGGNYQEKKQGKIEQWGNYLRYKYYSFDFSEVEENGLYVIEYGDQRTKPFRISESVYQKAWQPTLDIFFPVQMDHMLVNEAYRVWHGASHLDDALQAPVDHRHFDLYAQGPDTDTPYEPGEHIPGLNVGGWFDAGDYDIRTQTHYSTVMSLVQTWERFGIRRDQTSVHYDSRYVDMHHPDGKPDLLQQIEHGTKQLLAQHKAVGHAIPGIVSAHISQYTHLGDAVTKTDNLIYDPTLDSLETEGNRSEKFDDRWAFTSKSTPLNYGSIAALAAASRALKEYNPGLAGECLATAQKVWEEEHSHEPDIFRHGNTTGGPLKQEELKAAVELLLATEDQKYAGRISELWPYVDEHFRSNAIMAVRALPLMDDSYGRKLEARVKAYKDSIDRLDDKNPFGVPITRGGWAGAGTVIGFANTNYHLHKAFPDIIPPEYVYRGLHYIYGSHPGSSISFVSGVGTRSKEVAYGMNRADFSYIAGGVVPGMLILPPDFPENKEDWPYLWGENEYVINVGASYLFLVNAVNELLGE
jgi:hypothetical protein